MQKYAIVMLAALFILGCAAKPKEKIVLARVNNYEITQEEFQEEFKESAYARNETSESKKDFLNNLINRKLILQDAQQHGLDKEKSFLKMIERFWEQSLLKLAIEKKTKETTGSVLVTDGEIQDAYNKMFNEGKTVKTLSQMYQQIKWEITRQKQTQQLNEWINQLHKKADIKIDYNLLTQSK